MPEYEINSHTVDFLYEMAVENEAREKEAEVVMADLDQKTREYATESKCCSLYDPPRLAFLTINTIHMRLRECP